MEPGPEEAPQREGAQREGAQRVHMVRPAGLNSLGAGAEPRPVA
jgi:hypothetical protein